MKLGLSGILTRTFINSPLTPLLLLAALIAGAIAVASLPREEEPQISVPMVDIIVAANGYKADEAVELVTRPLEDIVKGIDGVEHVYSQTEDDRVVVTARFLVGTDQDVAVLRVHEKIRADIAQYSQRHPRAADRRARHQRRRDPRADALGRGRQGGEWTANGLEQVAEELQHELTKVHGVGSTYIVGGAPSEIRVEPDPERLALYGVTLGQLTDKLANANRSFLAGSFRENNKSIPVVAGQTLQGVPDIGLLLLTSRDGRPVYVKDVADVVVGSAEVDQRAWTMTRNAAGALERRPAVSLAVAKRKGENAVRVAEEVMKRLETIKGRIVPAGLEVTVTRNYGETANEKANELLFHLALATVSIVILITATIGWREGVVVLIIIPTTILLTLFASWMMGYTINRVSLFALIFSIGILVDDAIVVVENIVRRWSMRGSRGLVETAVEAVAEVGNPTIVATLAIVAALLPMMFVSGLMGPYMSPIPANASIAMLFSFFVAVTVTPWLLMRLAAKHFEKAGARRGAQPRHRRDGALLHPHREAAPEGTDALEGLPDLRRARHRRGVRPVRDQGRRGETAALRQQVRDPGHRRSAEGLVARGDGSRPEGGGGQAEGSARTDVDPGLRRDRGALQLQRPRAPLLSALGAADGRSLGQSDAEGRPVARQPCDRARYPQTAGGRAAAAARLDQGRRGPARASGALDLAGRGLRSGRGEPQGDGFESAPGVRVRRLRRRRRRQLRRPLRAAALLHRPGGARISRRAGAGGLRHDRRARRRDGGRLFAARQRTEADRDQGRAAAQRVDARRAHAVDAAAGWAARRARAPTSNSATSSR